MYRPTDVVTSLDEVLGRYAKATAAQQTKILDHVDDLIRVWVERSPFLTMATVSAAGQVDVSPKGDPAGFVKVLDDKTIAIPDRPGNHRFDTFANILDTGRIGLVFFVPNRNEVVRINGHAQIVEDTELRETMAIKGRVPDYAILVRVEEAFYHCGKAIIRSALWRPDAAAPIDGLPTYAEALMQQSDPQQSFEDLQARLDNNDKNRLYDE